MLSDNRIDEHARNASVIGNADELSGEAIYRFARAIEREARQQALEDAAEWVRMEGLHANADAMLCTLKETT